jgi:DNA-directed RNA polymerase subunit omega
MMTHPPLESVLEKVDCRYTLVTETAKRARQLVLGADCTVECDSNKPISMAVHEIDAGTVTYHSTREGK